MLELWLLVSLVILIALIWKPIKVHVLGGLDNRGQAIRNELDEAKRLHEEAKELLARHLAHSRVDGMGRPVHRCEDTGIEWIEERHSNGYAGETIVLRRVAR